MRWWWRLDIPGVHALSALSRLGYLQMGYLHANVEDLMEK